GERDPGPERRPRPELLPDARPEVPLRRPLAGEGGRFREQPAQAALRLPAGLAGGEAELHLLELALGERAVHVIVEQIVDFSAGHGSSASRRRRRARWSWALDVPVAIPSMCAISSCL